MQNQIILSIRHSQVSIFVRPVLLEAELSMQTSRNLRNSDRNPGTVEASFVLKDTFAQNKCSEAKILNDQQPEKSQDKLLILDSVGNSSRKKTEEFKPDTVTLKTK